jgi:hypothetical protein
MPNEEYKCGCVYNIDCPSLDRDAYRYVAMVIYRNGEITEKEMCDSVLYIYANDMLNIVESRWGYGEIEEYYREKHILVHPEEYRK